MQRPYGRSWSPAPITKRRFRIAASLEPFAPGSKAIWAFGSAGKVSKRLVEVGAIVETGQPLATLDEVDLKLQAEQAEAEFPAAGGVLAQASAAETRAKELRQKGWSTDAQLDQAKADSRRSAGEAQSRRTIGRTHEKQSVLRDACRRRSRRRHRDADRARSGRHRGANRDPRGAACRKGGRCRDPRDALGARQVGRSPGLDLVAAGQALCREAARACPFGRSRDADLSRQVLDARCWRRGATRHDGDADPVRSGERTRRAAAAVGAVQPGCRAVGLCRRCARPAWSRSSRWR